MKSRPVSFHLTDFASAPSRRRHGASWASWTRSRAAPTRVRGPAVENVVRAGAIASWASQWASNIACYERCMNPSPHAVAYRQPRLHLLRLREETCSPPEATSDWTRVHERLASLGKDRSAHERELCRWLLAAQRLAVHARAGFASLGEYAERLVGLNGRQTEERSAWDAL